MPRAAAAHGWHAAPDARSAASVPSLSISSTRCACGKAWKIWKSTPRSVPRESDSVRASRSPGSHRSFPEISSAACCMQGEEAERQFADFANDEPCPVLDPETGLCELYESRPIVVPGERWHRDRT